MAQNTVFAQIVKLIPRTFFQNWVTEYNGDKGVRILDCWTWFGSLLFGQISGHDSIRALERVFSQGEGLVRKLGFRAVCRSTLADANRTRPLGILEKTFQYALQRARTTLPRNSGFRFHGDIFALDSTTIELCLTLCPWARFHHEKGAAKLHTAIDLAGDLPQFAVITDGRVHDVTVAKSRRWFTPSATVVFDKAYMDYGDLYKARWKVELFFRTLKQHLKIKKFLGTSINAVKAQILVALIAYLLIQILRHATKGTISIPETMAILATMLLLKQPIMRLLGQLPRTTRYPPDRQLLLPF